MPANMSAILSGRGLFLTIRAIRAFSSRLPIENITFSGSRIYENPASLWQTSPPLPQTICVSGVLVMSCRDLIHRIPRG